MVNSLSADAPAASEGASQIVAAAREAIATTRLCPAPQDRFVRLTDCRWSARKLRAVTPYHTLHRWLCEMKSQRPEAWAVLVSAGVRVDGKSVRHRGKVITGARLCAHLRPLLKNAAVSEYVESTTLAALARWAELPVSPGPWGSRLVGAGLSSEGVFRLGRVRVALEIPNDAARIKDLLELSQDVARAASMTVEHPDLIRAGLWSLTDSGVASRPRAKEALKSIAYELRQQLPTGRALGKSMPHKEAPLIAMGLAEELGVLRRLVWPSAQAVDTSRLAAVVQRLAQRRRTPVKPTTGWDLAL